MNTKYFWKQAQLKTLKPGTPSSKAKNGGPKRPIDKRSADTNVSKSTVRSLRSPTTGHCKNTTGTVSFDKSTTVASVS